MQEPNDVAERVAQNQKRNRWLLIIIIILLAIIALLVGLKLFSEDTPKSVPIEEELRASDGIMPGMSEEEIQARLDAIVEEGMFNASMNGVVHFADGKSEGDVNIENIEANRYACTVEIYLKNTDECVLKTGLIKPGKYLQYAALDRPLVDGAFDCTAVFSAYDAESMTAVGKVNMDIVILVGA